MTTTYLSDAEVLERFSRVVTASLHIDASRVTPDAHLDDLGAESLDLIEITMETEAQFNIYLPDKSILDTAGEVFGPGVLEKDGCLTEEGKRLMLARMPEADANAFAGQVAVKDLKRYFMQVGTWVRMIQGLAQHTPQACAACGGSMVPSLGFRVKCSACGEEVTLRSGEELNREWVQDYYQRHFQPRTAGTAATVAAQS